MVLGVQHLPRVAAEAGAYVTLDEEALLHPEWARPIEGRESARGDVEIGLEQTLELEQRLLVEHDRFQCRGFDAGGSEAVCDCLAWKARVTFHACKTLFLCCRDYPVPGEQACSAAVVESRYSKDVFARQMSPLALCG